MKHLWLKLSSYDKVTRLKRRGVTFTNKMFPKKNRDKRPVLTDVNEGGLCSTNRDLK